MCTITYLPLSGGSALLTHSRDESLVRPSAKFPVRQQRKGRALLFPQDPEGGGSWIATDEQHRLVCLMNGGTGQHEPNPPYRLSRGQVLLDAAATPTQSFIDEYPLQNIEPFTILFFETKKELVITELRWDSREKHLRHYAAEQPLIWIAPQIYSAQEQQQRKKWFQEWLSAHPEFSAETVQKLHVGDGSNSPNMLLQHKLGRTVSVTQAQLSAGHIALTYTPLPENKQQQIRKKREIEAVKEAYKET